MGLSPSPHRGFRGGEQEKDEDDVCDSGGHVDEPLLAGVDRGQCHCRCDVGTEVTISEDATR
jgi:hypothetical protein